MIREAHHVLLGKPPALPVHRRRVGSQRYDAPGPAHVCRARWVATFGAFFATQRLKRTPPPVNAILRDAALLAPSFTIEDDDVTVNIVSRGCTASPSRRALNEYRQLSLTAWDGRDNKSEGQRNISLPGSRCARLAPVHAAPTPSSEDE